MHNTVVAITNNDNDILDSAKSCCRICLMPSSPLDNTNICDSILPCKCRQPIHIMCLVQQLIHHPKYICEICNSEYAFDAETKQLYFPDLLLNKPVKSQVHINIPDTNTPVINQRYNTINTRHAPELRNNLQPTPQNDSWEFCKFAFKKFLYFIFCLFVICVIVIMVSPKNSFKFS